MAIRFHMSASGQEPISADTNGRSAKGQQRSHIANSRIQIAPTVSANETVNGSVYFQSYRAMAQGWTSVAATRIDLAQAPVGRAKRPPTGTPTSQRAKRLPHLRRSLLPISRARSR
jgi:hypothetical protein